MRIQFHRIFHARMIWLSQHLIRFLLIVDCREVTALRKVAGEGEGNDLAVGLRNMAACVVLEHTLW